MMDLNTIWFVLIAVLIAGYAVLDGFDLGVGVLHPFAEDDRERRMHLNAIGPVWDGNEVWLLTGGGALFAAFPVVYATVFSGFYLAFMLLVAALMFRAASFEFRGKVGSARWRGFWDWSFTVGSVIPALLYGVAVGNVLRGLPIDAAGDFTGSFIGLLNPYALLVGVLTLCFFTMHGAAYMCLKVNGPHRERMRRWVLWMWLAFVALYATATVATALVAGHLFQIAVRRPVFWIGTVVLLLAVIAIPLFSRARQFGRAFLASSVTMLAMVTVTAAGLFPRLVPSLTNAAYGLTVYNAASSPRTLTVMLVIALVGMPLVLIYTAYVYRVFKGKVVLTEESY